jgi:COP9 signalosome complex subunit 5
MLDLSNKIQQAATGISRNGKGLSGSNLHRAIDQQLEKIVKDSSKIAGEEIMGLMAGEVKAKLFNGLGSGTRSDVEEEHSTSQPDLPAIA